MTDNDKTYKATISGCNVFTVKGPAYVLWIHSLEDGRVHVKMVRSLDAFMRKDWYIDDVFDSEEDAIDKCLAAIMARGYKIKLISPMRRGVI